MDEQTALRNEAIELIKRATPEALDTALKYMQLMLRCPAFNEAVKAATPDGEINPPLPVLQRLIDEYAEQEGVLE